MARYSLLVFLACAGAGAAVAPEDAVKRDLEQFQGSWKAVAILQADGLPAPDEDVLVTRLAVVGTKFTMTGKNYVINGTFTIDPSKTPKEIDVLLASENGPQVRLLGIYQIQGSTRQSRFALPEKSRPTQFTSEKGFVGFTWTRD